MTRLATTLTIGALCAVLGSSAIAQVDREVKRTDKDLAAWDHRNLFTLDDLIGANVKLGIVAVEKDGDVKRVDEVKRVEGDPVTTKPVTSKAKEGEIEDVIVDLRDGHCAWAIVGVGGLLGIGEKKVAVPCNVLRREFRPGEKVGDKPLFVLSATEEDLKKLNAFKKSEAKPNKEGIETVVREAEASWAVLNKTRDVGEAKPASHKADHSPDAPHMMLGSCMDDFKLLAASKDFGSISKCILECCAVAAPASGTEMASLPRVRYFVVSRGGVAGIGDTLYLVPLAATTLVRQGDSWAWSVPQTVEQIESGGVRYKKPEAGVLERDMCQRAEDFFKASKTSEGHNPK